MSKQSLYRPGEPLRGGVPVIFPWFGPKPGDPAAPPHAFARRMTWEIQDVRTQDGQVTVVFSLAATPASHAVFPHDFTLTYAVTIGSELSLALTVHNRSAAPFTYEQALHTYLAVGDVRQVSITGLAGATYLDNAPAGGGSRVQQGPDPIRIQAETDRCYLNTAATCVVDDPALGRRISIAKQNSATTVVWNPWIDKSKKMPDFGDDEWPGMLCIETANARDNAVTLAAGATHTMTAVIKVSLV